MDDPYADLPSAKAADTNHSSSAAYKNNFIGSNLWSTQQKLLATRRPVTPTARTKKAPPPSPKVEKPLEPIPMQPPAPVPQLMPPPPPKLAKEGEKKRNSGIKGVRFGGIPDPPAEESVRVLGPARALGVKLDTRKPEEDRACAMLEVTKDGVFVGRIDLSREITILGRDATAADEVLEHQSCSRKHCLIAHGVCQGVFVADLSSAHGTFHTPALISGPDSAAGAPSKPKAVKLGPKQVVRLREGDILRFGASSRTYTIRLGPGAALAESIKRAEEQAEVARKQAEEKEKIKAELEISREQRRKEVAQITADLLSSAPTYQPQANSGKRKKSF